jgi:capsular polysaccharide biosynthesis protein
VNGFGENPRAVSQITSSPAAQQRAASRAHIPPAELQGRVTVAQVGVTPGSSTTRGTLISVTVTGAHPANVEDAANALADIVVEKTTASYVGVKIATFQRTLSHVNDQITSINNRLAVITAAEKAAKDLDPLQQLVVVSQEDNAETRLGNLIQEQEVLQQQLAFATQVESARVVEPARAVKSGPRSHNTSLIVGAFIGLLLGAVAAIILHGRRPAATA